jgi:hypothetical protein
MASAICCGSAIGVSSYAQVDVMVAEAGRIKTQKSRLEDWASPILSHARVARAQKPRPGCAAPQAATWIAPAVSQSAGAGFGSDSRRWFDNRLAISQHN